MVERESKWMGKARSSDGFNQEKSVEMERSKKKKKKKKSRYVQEIELTQKT